MFHSFIVSGLHLRLVHIPGESPDQMGVWIPDKKAFLCGDDLYRTFPNLYAVRGTPSRNALEWVSSLDKMRALSPEYLIPSHTQPLIGKEFIYETLTVYRDAIQFVHDQTVRYLNKGYFPNDIAPKVKLPKKLSSNPFLYELYGTVQWSVKAVFSHYMGWFSGDVVELNSLTSVERAQRMVKLVGSAHSLVRSARVALDEDDYQWALELASHVLVLHPDHDDASVVRLQAIKKLAASETSPNGRNYYLTVALEDYGLLQNRISNNIKRVAIESITVKQLWIGMKSRMMPEVCDTIEKTTIFNFTDIEEVYSLHMRNGILDVMEGESDKWHYKVSVTFKTWKEILVQIRSSFAAYMSSDLVVDGGMAAFGDFMKCFEKDDE